MWTGNYSLRPEILVGEMDVSRTKVRLDTSIPPTNISGRREYLASFNESKRTLCNFLQ